MNDDRIKGNWKQLKGSAKKEWGKLTDDDLQQVDGDRERLSGKIQERYGLAQKEANEQIERFERREAPQDR